MPKKVWKPFEQARRALLARLAAGERLLAQGRVDEIPLGSGPSGSTYDYIVVTDRRLLVGKHALAADRSRDFDITLDAVSSQAEHLEGHRWFVSLRHEPVTRVRHRAKHNVLWMHWGDDWSPIADTDTVLHFSGRETAAAKALREQLASRGVPGHEWTIKWPSLAGRRRLWARGGVAGLPRVAVLRSERDATDAPAPDQ